MATWRPRGGPAGVTIEIGIAVLPEHRRQGIATAAQKTLVEHLLDHTTAHRIEALTNEGNVGERRALERLGFQHEGLMRERSFIRGRYVGVHVYALLRSDHRPGTR
jgi:RimJ/RimL family protein N-acetyltransferase